MTDHDHEEHEEVPEPRTESLQVLDLIGIGALTIGNVVGAIGNGFAMVAMELFSAARLRRLRQDEERWRREEEQARREGAEELNRLLRDHIGRPYDG